MTTRKKILSFFTILLLVGLASCYQPEDGCLDTYASNYDVTADEACENCCTYPSLSWRVTHAEEELTFRSDSLLTDIDGNDFAIRQIEFFVADFVITLEDGQQLIVADSIQLSINDQNDYYKNDFSHVNLSRSTNVLGELSSDGVITGFSFKIGLDPIYNNLDFTDLSASFPLKTFEDSLYTNGAFVDVELAMERDTAAHDTLTLQIQNTAFFQEINLDYNLEIEKGKDIVLPTKIDYHKWFLGINALTYTAEEIGQVLSDNAASAFSIP